MNKYAGVIFLITLLLLLLNPIISKAENSSDLNKTISELQQKISDLQGQESTLSKQLTLLNSQIALATLKVRATKAAVTKLDLEIQELSSQIGDLEKQKTQRLELVVHRAPEVYKRAATPAFGAIFLSQNFSELLSRIKYIAYIQEKDAKLYWQYQLTQSNYNERKDEREKKKVQQEQLKKQYEAQSQELARKQREKQALLDETKNNESNYQRLLAQALAEKQAIERALVDSVKVGDVKRGDVIALVGNTGYPGCSTGAHLHFEVRKNNAWVDPGQYLSSKTILDVQDPFNIVNWTVGGGGWDWPLSDTIKITQHFGQTPYSYRYTYSGGIHTGYDMVSSSSDFIKAPADGVLYSSSESCGDGSIIKIKYIDHGGGLISFYLHVQ